MTMLYTPLTKIALKLCYDLHRDQFDKAGMPYVFHPFHLAEQMNSEAEICVALLHDVLEDTGIDRAYLEKAGFSDDIMDALNLLTHDPKVPYMTYIASLRENAIAAKVKRVDLEHNADLTRLDRVKPSDLKRQMKYRMALALLDECYFDPVMDCYYQMVPLNLDNTIYLTIYYNKTNTIINYKLLVTTPEPEMCEFSPMIVESLTESLHPDQEQTLSIQEVLAIALNRMSGAQLIELIQST